MKLLTLAAACAALVTLTAAPALAAEAVTARLQAPVAKPVKFIAGGAMFICDGDACVARAATSETLATATCRTVAAKVGPVVAFEGAKALDAARLADCNSQLRARAAGPQLAKQ